MTTRINEPDTPADIELRACLDSDPVRSFVMKAGAGSGKTTSLVKALAHLFQNKGSLLKRRGQQIACITYTEVAVGEIWGDVGNASLFHVSTIHSFLWNIIRPFQEDIRAWVKNRILEKLETAEEKLASPGTQAATKAKAKKDVDRYKLQLDAIESVDHFTYNIGSNYAEGVLGHDDILKLGPAMITEGALMRRIVADRFPYLFIDESQDTFAEVVDAFRLIARQHADKFCLGFFGDPMQKIYMTGVGPITLDEIWLQITKPENFRCPKRVLDVVNRIRAAGDGLVQTRGRMIEENGQLVSVPGAARMFILPADNHRTARLGQVRTWLSQNSGDPLWLDDSDEGGVKVMVLVHRMAADRMGFPAVYAALNDNGSRTLKEGLLDGTAWILRPFLQFVLPLVHAMTTGQDFEAMTLLRAWSPELQPDAITSKNARVTLDRIGKSVEDLVALVTGNAASTRDVLSFLLERNLYPIDDRLKSYLEGLPPAGGDDGSGDDSSVAAFFACPASEMRNYERYVKNESPFDTHQGVKGAQFSRVLVVLDDEEANYNSFSYGKYFGITDLSGTDQANIAQGKESVLDRTRRLFYVCCSRAVGELAVVFFVSNDQIAPAIEAAKALFRPEDVLTLNDIE
jgi:DNA helicase II / ATP-dependent DNA helicase PcrA